MTIDTHQHFWVYNQAEHIWMTDEYAALRRPYLPTDLEPLLRTAGVEGTVAVQARQNLEETEWLLSLCDQYEFIKGVVGWVDLCSEDARSQLEHYAPHPRFKGVRHVIHDEPDERFMLRSDFRRGLSLLGDFDLTYDLLLFPRHLPYAVELVADFPDQPFILDHIGKPDIAAQEIEPWLSGLRRLGAFPNVSCKLSGMLTLARWKSWHSGDFDRYVQGVFEVFGADRLMLGSDWPVCTVSGSYEESINLTRRLLDSLSAADRERIRGGTARAVYRLG